MTYNFTDSSRLFIYTLAALELVLILQLVQMSFAVWSDSYISKRERRILLIISLIVLTLIIQGHLDFMVGQNVIGSHNPLIATAVSVYGYVFRPVVIVLFILMTDQTGRVAPAWILCAINAVIQSRSTT